MEKIQEIIARIIAAVKGILARMGLELGDDVDAGFTL